MAAIRSGEKRPTLDNWGCGDPPERYLAAGQNGWGTGTFCRSAPGLDLDVRNRQLVRLLVETTRARSVHRELLIGAFAAEVAFVLGVANDGREHPPVVSV